MGDGQYSHMWYALPSVWSYVPYMSWMPSNGIHDRWSMRVPWGSQLWEARVWPGLQSYTAAEVYCADFVEFFASMLLHLPTPPPYPSDYIGILRYAMLMHEQHLQVKFDFFDAEGQNLRCHEKVLAIHLMNGFKD